MKTLITYIAKLAFIILIARFNTLEAKVIDLSKYFLSGPTSIKNQAKYKLNKNRQQNIDNQTYHEIFMHEEDQTKSSTECFGEVYQPAQYIEKTIEIEISAEYFTKKSIPPKFEKIRKKILLKPGYFTYNKKSKEIFHTQIKKYLIQPAEKILSSDNQTITKKPAQFKEITRKTIAKHPNYAKEWVPPKYMYLDVESQISETKIIADKKERKTIKLKHLEKITDGKKVTKRIICDKFLSPAIVDRIQSILFKEGFIAEKTGAYDLRTKNALKAYQSKYRLSQGSLDIQTLGAMGLIAH